MDVRWTPQAMRETNRIFLYIASENHYAAQDVFRAMHTTAQSLGRFP
jgi:plasmid stabilization system protein ParE